MTQVLSTPFHECWTSEVHYERTKSNWLESYPRSHHYSRKRQEAAGSQSQSPAISTSLSDLIKKPVEEMKKLIPSDSSISNQESENLPTSQINGHSLRSKRTLRRPSISESYQNVTTDRKSSRRCEKGENPNPISTQLEPPLQSKSKKLVQSNQKKSDLATENTNTFKREKSPINNSVTSNAVEEPHRSNIAVAVPSWRIRVYTGKYIIEGTEDLSDNVFDERHTKHEISERKRKKRDEKCLEDLEKLGKLSRQNLSPCGGSKKKIMHIEILESEPRCAFGYVIPDIPQEDFSLPPEFLLCRRRRTSNKLWHSTSESSVDSTHKYGRHKKIQPPENS